MLLLGVVIAIVGVVIGAGHAWSGGRSPLSQSSPGRLEIVAVFLNGLLASCGLLFILVAVVAKRSTSPMFLGQSVTLLAAIASPLLLWRTRWRGVAEGIAVVAFGTLIVVAGFSFGPYLLPFALVMILGGLQGVRLAH